MIFGFLDALFCFVLGLSYRIVVLIPSTSSLVGIGANRGDELVTLAILWNRDAASIKESLEARVRPAIQSSLEAIFGLQLGIISSASILVTSLGGSSAKGILGSASRTRSLLRKVVAVLTGQRNEFVALGALGNLDVMLIEEFLQLGVGPGVEKLLAQRLFGSFGFGRCRCGNAARLQADEAGVAAYGCNELVAGGGLGCGPSTLV